MKRDLYLFPAVLVIAAVLFGCGGSGMDAPQENVSQTVAVPAEGAPKTEGQSVQEPASAAKEEPAATVTGKPTAVPTKEPQEPVLIYENEHIRLYINELYPSGKDANLELENKDPEQAYRVVRTSSSEWLEGDLTVNGIPMDTEKSSFDLAAGETKRANFGTVLNKMKARGIEAITDLEFRLSFYPGEPGEGDKLYRTGGTAFSTGVLHVTFGEDGEVRSFEELSEVTPEQAVVLDNEHIRVSVSELCPDGKNAILSIENKDSEQAYRIERTSGSQWLGKDLLINGIPQYTDEKELDLLSGDTIRSTFGIREANLKEAGIETITEIEFRLNVYPGGIDPDDRMHWTPRSVIDTKVLHVTFGEDGKVQSAEQKEEAFPEHTVLIETDILRLSVIHDTATKQDVCFLAENSDPVRHIQMKLYPNDNPGSYGFQINGDKAKVSGTSEFWADAGEAVICSAHISSKSFPLKEILFRTELLYGVPHDGGQSFDPNQPDYVTGWIRVEFDDAGYVKTVMTDSTVLEPESAAEPETADEGLTQEEKDFLEALRLYYEELDYKGAYKLLKPYKNPTIGAMAAFMGDCNYLGKGTSENNNEAYRLYSLAADLGCGLGYYGKGMCTNFGYGVKKDQDAARELFKTALELLPGEIESFTDPHLKGLAAFYLGRIHYYGLMDGFRSSSKAMPYLEQAAEYHNPEALGLLGEYSYNNRSKEEALQYYTEAADYGNAGGAYNAGMMYLDGVGTEKNGELAVKYLQLAVDYGFSQARSDLNTAKKLQKEQANGNG